MRVRRAYLARPVRRASRHLRPRERGGNRSAGPRGHAGRSRQPASEGDRVLFRRAACGRCPRCAAGESCQVNRGYGFLSSDEFPHIRGGFGQYLYMEPSPWLWRVPDDMPTERALLSVVGNHTVLNGIEKIGGIRWRTPLSSRVRGPSAWGPWCRRGSWARRGIIAVGAPPNRLALAKEMGADETIDIGEHPEPEDRVTLVHDLTQGRGADVVIECSGAGTAVQEGLEMVRQGGKYLVVGQATDYGTKPINPSLITRKAVLMSGVLSSSRQNIIRSFQAMHTVGAPARGEARDASLSAGGRQRRLSQPRDPGSHGGGHPPQRVGGRAAWRFTER